MRPAGRAMPRLTFVTPDGGRQEIEAPIGLSIMQVARMHDLGVEGTCDGSLACATCHVIVAPDDFDRLEIASAEEEDMLDLATGLEPTSRLGCQILLTDELDGLTVRLPPSI
jgi:ferredoxin, 2Fe-2S